MIGIGVFPSDWGERRNIVDKDDGRVPIRIEFYEMMQKMMEILMYPDSSGKIGVSLAFSGNANKHTAVLVLCTVPKLLLDMRQENADEWKDLTFFAADLADEARLLLDNDYPDEDD